MNSCSEKKLLEAVVTNSCSLLVDRVERYVVALTTGLSRRPNSRICDDFGLLIHNGNIDGINSVIADLF